MFLPLDHVFNDGYIVCDFLEIADIVMVLADFKAFRLHEHDLRRGLMCVIRRSLDSDRHHHSGAGTSHTRARLH